MTAGREQDARETLRAAVEARMAAYAREGMGDYRDGYKAALEDVLDDFAALLPSPPATTQCGWCGEHVDPDDHLCAPRPHRDCYTHDKCGFHWHNVTDPMDLPLTTDGFPEPVCPRCEVVRLRAEIAGMVDLRAAAEHVENLPPGHLPEFTEREHLGHHVMIAVLIAAVDRIKALCDEAEYVVLATDDPGTAPVKAVAVTDLVDALNARVSL